MPVLSLVALAAPLGPPVAAPDALRVFLSATAEMDTAVLREKGCDGDACAAQLQRRGMGADLELAVLPGLGLQANISRVSADIPEAAITADGSALGLGLRLATPLRDQWGVAAALQGRWTQADGALDSAIDGKELRVTAAATWGSPEGGFVLWFGGQAPVWTSLNISPSLDDSDGLLLSMTPGRPISGLAGVWMLSERLGLPWRASSRFSAGAEAWVGQDNGLSARIGLGF